VKRRANVHFTNGTILGAWADENFKDLKRTFLNPKNGDLGGEGIGDRITEVQTEN